MARDSERSINPVTLKINGEELEKEYRNVSMVDGIYQFRYGYGVGVFFYAVFIIIDFQIYPEVAEVLLAVRLFLVIPVLLLGLLFSFMSFYPRFAKAVNLIAVMVAGAGIIIKIILGASAPGISMSYTSLILIMIFLYTFFKMHYMDAFLVSMILSATYLVVAYVILGLPQNLFIFQAFYLGGANVLGTSVAYVIELQSKKEFLLKRKLSESAVKDALTGLYNRHYFDQFLTKDIEDFITRSKGIRHIERRLGDLKTAKYGLFMVDIDSFKRINDTFGHHSGDLVLKQFASLLKKHVRRTDAVLRVGGEEFLLVLKLTTEDYLIEFMKRIGRAIENNDFKIEGGGIIGCTASIGLVVIPNRKTEDVGELIRYADRALYRSKDMGRNRGHRIYDLQGEIEFEEILWCD